MVMGWLDFLWFIIWPTYFRLWFRNPGVLWLDLSMVVVLHCNTDVFWSNADLALQVQHMWTTTMDKTQCDKVNEQLKKMTRMCKQYPTWFDKCFTRIPAYHKLTIGWSRSGQGVLHDRISKYVFMVQVMLGLILYFVDARYPALHLVLSLVCTASIDKGMPFYIPNLSVCTLLAPYALSDAIQSTFMTKFLENGVTFWVYCWRLAMPVAPLMTVAWIWKDESDFWVALFCYQSISMSVTTLYVFVGYCHCPSQPLWAALTLTLLEMAFLPIIQHNSGPWNSIHGATKTAFVACFRRTIVLCMILALCGCVINLARKARAYKAWKYGWLRQNVLDRCMCFYYSEMYGACTFSALFLNFCSTMITAYFVYDAYHVSDTMSCTVPGTMSCTVPGTMSGTTAGFFGRLYSAQAEIANSE